MFFNPRIERFGAWILWGLLILLGWGGQGCSSMPVAHSTHRGLLDVDRTPQVAAAPLPFQPRRTPASFQQKEDLPSRPFDSHARSEFVWPLKKVSITSAFGKRGRGPLHQGVDLRATVGTPVFAAHSGKVIYSGSKIAGYGKLVVIKDARGYSTVYAHNSKLLVLAGQEVKRGQKIALSGATGTVRGAHLHFEVRQGVVARDPEKLLTRR